MSYQELKNKLENQAVLIINEINAIDAQIKMLNDKRERLNKELTKLGDELSSYSVESLDLSLPPNELGELLRSQFYRTGFSVKGQVIGGTGFGFRKGTKPLAPLGRPAFIDGRGQYTRPDVWVEREIGGHAIRLLQFRSGAIVFTIDNQYLGTPDLIRQDQWEWGKVEDFLPQEGPSESGGDYGPWEDD